LPAGTNIARITQQQTCTISIQSLNIVKKTLECYADHSET